MQSKGLSRVFSNPEGWDGEGSGGSGWGTHVNPWLIHVNVWQKPLPYCKIISLQLIKINERKKKRLLQHHSSKASVLPCSAFFMVQLSHPYLTTGKTIALTIWTFVSKVMALLFNTRGTLLQLR